MKKDQLSLNQLRDYATVFSRKSILSFLNGNLKDLDLKIDRYDEEWRRKGESYLGYFRYIYRIIDTHYQNEYVYKNNLLNEWLIREIGETDSRLFSEFRVGKAIADLAIFNGISKAFEIKTELDSDKRLSLQIKNYQRAFNETYLIVPVTQLDKYVNFNLSIGLISFDPMMKKFTKERPAAVNMEVCPDTLMHILHTSEYKSIVEDYYGFLPDMTSFNMFDRCYKLIKEIDSLELNRLFINQMKKRRRHQALSIRYFKELNQLSLALDLSKKALTRLIQILQQPINRSSPCIIHS